ncbi:hypothetical protein ABEG18_17740 [Alsobacter sp. KACC 23698]|uniref:Uncharacterized protein n=1 Tax=Alsobacter sp. KACC 23698 TaxID=3149229 RepID=A0AAU7JBJ5_9HYPH
MKSVIAASVAAQSSFISEEISRMKPLLSSSGIRPEKSPFAAFLATWATWSCMATSAVMSRHSSMAPRRSPFAVMTGVTRRSKVRRPIRIRVTWGWLSRSSMRSWWAAFLWNTPIDLPRMSSGSKFGKAVRKSCTCSRNSDFTDVFMKTIRCSGSTSMMLPMAHCSAAAARSASWRPASAWASAPSSPPPVAELPSCAVIRDSGPSSPRATSWAAAASTRSWKARSEPPAVGSIPPRISSHVPKAAARAAAPSDAARPSLTVCAFIAGSFRDRGELQQGHDRAALHREGADKVVMVSVDGRRGLQLGGRDVDDVGDGVRHIAVFACASPSTFTEKTVVYQRISSYSVHSWLQ